MNRNPLAALGALVLIVAAVVLAAVLAFGRSGAHAAGPGPYGYGPGMMGGYSASAGDAIVLIRHQQAHCHTWAVDGGAFAADQKLTLEHGATVTVIDDDVMSHRLVELAGALVSMRNGTTMPMMGAYVGTAKVAGLMNYMGSTTSITFDKPGVYSFRTHAGEDYFPGITTTGADNVLTLKVTVR